MKTTKIKSSLLLTTLIIGLASIAPAQAQEKFQHERLITIWETKTDLKTPESVLYDAESGLVFVSNVNANPWEKDGNGFISTLNLKGDILSAKWITGLSGPKGMGVYKGKLYVTDIDEVVEIDIKKGEISKRYPIPGAKKLNDISVDKSGTVYISDMGDAAIYKLKKSNIDLFLKSNELQNVNGLFVHGNSLLAGLGGRLVSIDTYTKAIVSFVDNTCNIDGITATGKGTYLISDWEGHIYEIKSDQMPLLLLDTTPLEINAADIEYIKDQNILLVPTFYKDNVVAYRLKLD